MGIGLFRLITVHNLAQNNEKAKCYLALIIFYLKDEKWADDSLIKPQYLRRFTAT